MPAWAGPCAASAATAIMQRSAFMDSSLVGKIAHDRIPQLSRRVDVQEDRNYCVRPALEFGWGGASLLPAADRLVVVEGVAAGELTAAQPGGEPVDPLRR